MRRIFALIRRVASLCGNYLKEEVPVYPGPLGLSVRVPEMGDPTHHGDELEVLVGTLDIPNDRGECLHL